MKTTIIDVRSAMEFADGHFDGSINIPLSQLNLKLDYIKQLRGRILLCCASGIRSSQAEMFLRRNGVNCENAGSWQQLQKFLN